MEYIFLDFIKITKKEDLTTSILDYLINQNIDKTFSSIFFESIGIKNARYETEQQKPIERGFLDLFIETSDSYIILENKFDAPFTWNDEDGHQLYKYCKWLNKENVKYKYLVILTISRRKKEVQEYIDNELHEFSKIKICVIFWETLLKKCLSLTTNNEIKFVISTLNLYISNNFSKYHMISKEGVKMLCSKAYAKAFIEIEDMIIKIKETISQNSIFEISQPKKSLFEPEFGSIGVYFKNNKNEYWFGLNPSLWSQTGFPLYLEVRSINEKYDFNEIDQKIIEVFTKNGFTRKYTGLNYIFDLNEFNDEDKIFHKIRLLAV